MPNRLAHETSPYLLQHQNNPVNWFPWGEEALTLARTLNKPIFLSIGYAACHWCHVMEHESFEDPATAALMNDLFINIKVDREERPDLDSIYMGAVVALTGHGGWPMSVFLTPQGEPFFGGTYFPPAQRGGMPAFSQVLQGVHEAWLKRHDDVVSASRDLLEQLKTNTLTTGEGGAAPTRDTLAEATKSLWRTFDWKNHGWGGAPKFPQPMAIEFLLRYHVLTGEATPYELASKALNALARGGIYDHLGGGFHRYATDAIWLVPHFEKMLYDNAQLARAYTHAWQLSGSPLYQKVATETLDYVAREMTDPLGGFYATQDADSEGEEGKFFVWGVPEIDHLLGAEAALFKAAYGVQPGGNFEGHSILFRALDVDDLAERFKLPPAEVTARLARARAALLARREHRVKPGLDDKVLTAWNGLMLAAFAEAASAFNREDYRQLAVRNADFALAHLRRAEGRLWRSWRRGTAKLNGYLEDYANLAEGLLAVYAATFDERYALAARALADDALAHFSDPAGGFFDTSDDHETLVLRPKDVQDNATPSGSAMLTGVLFQLAALTGEAHYAEAAHRALHGVAPLLARYPTGFAQWLSALTFALSEPREIALVGEGDALTPLLQVVRRGYRPFQVVAVKAPGAASDLPVLAGREALSGQATAYVCRQFTCQQPVTTPEALRAQLA